ncbi:nucleotidyltransferase family protein [Halosimplex pelagicum]|uniref:Nucleotidyltransferase family protein n=1 Tax=Halosimplex pelagicum TaxID=869886 RepID=A0A7D5P7Y4_9EURY|nr:nucleotidyltransferase family protein [Halosimplex pelagicum]QLH80884.1 nucleotidyltransferase family protein [Halosimplex pelagicum]
MIGDPTVAGVLLAAGDSDRFGERDKLLATLDGGPLVRHAARTLADAEVGPVAAVVDPGSTGVRDALAGLDVAVVGNPDAAAGQAASVRHGVAWARDRADAVVFALGDMPRVDPETVDRLVAAYRDGRGSALAAGYEGERGNPVLFDGRHFDALAAVEGDTGGRAVFERADDAAVVETGDPGVRLDVDRPGDLDGLRE